MIFLLGRMYLKSHSGYHNFLVFASMLSSLILDCNKKVTNRISPGMSSDKNKPFGDNLEPTMSNLTNGRVILKSSNSALVQKSFFIV